MRDRRGHVIEVHAGNRRAVITAAERRHLCNGFRLFFREWIDNSVIMKGAWRSRLKLLKLCHELISFKFWIVKPVGGPYAQDFPTQATQHFFPQAVTITGAFTRMIAGAIAFNASKESFFMIRMSDSKIDLIT